MTHNPPKGISPTDADVGPSAFIHPEYGKPLSGKPIKVDGVTFRPYRRGILSYIRLSEDFRIAVYRPLHGSTYRASVDGIGIATKFRSETRAFRAAIAKATSPADKANAL